MKALRDAPDGMANPDWVHQTASRPLGDAPAASAQPIDARALRRSATEAALAAKLLNAHLQNRLQLMQTNPTELRDLPFENASLLLRAMIAAGHADGELGDDERARLVAIAERGVPDPAQRRELLATIDTPPALEEIVRRIETPEMAERVYAVSAATLDRANEVNRSYLTYLAARLGLARDVVLRINAITAGAGR